MKNRVTYPGNESSPARNTQRDPNSEHRPLFNRRAPLAQSTGTSNQPSVTPCRRRSECYLRDCLRAQECSYPPLSVNRLACPDEKDYTDNNKPDEPAKSYDSSARRPLTSDEPTRPTTSIPSLYTRAKNPVYPLVVHSGHTQILPSPDFRAQT